MSITINDLDINQELDNNALQNILGGRRGFVYKSQIKEMHKRYTKPFSPSKNRYQSRIVLRSTSRLIHIC